MRKTGSDTTSPRNMARPSYPTLETAVPVCSTMLFATAKSPIILVCAALIFCQRPTLASDWGYDGAPDPPEQPRSSHPVELHATPPALIVSPRDPAASKPGASPKKIPGNTGANATKLGTSIPKVPPNKVPLPTGLSAGQAATADRADPDKQASVCWQQLFQVAAKAPLSYEQQKRFEDYMLAKSKLGEKNANEVRSILKFWPGVVSTLRDKPDLETGYISLFHALLRIREAMPLEKLDVPGEVTSDSDLITELLGIQRTAVPGTPPLTEEAINAYADLTCFIYEQKNPGKSVDADDNRALLARVVADKFKAAPTDADKKAMAHFDLAWSKFRILWDNADAPTRKIMLDKLTKDGAGSSLALAKDPLLERVLSAWPWPTKP